MYNFLIYIDKLLNYYTGGEWPETLCARWGRRARRGCRTCNYICKLLGYFEPDHCKKAVDYWDRYRYCTRINDGSDGLTD